MILTLLSLAVAADVLPSTFNPSAVPFSQGQRVQVEMDLGAMRRQGSFLGTWESEDVVGGVRTAFDLTDTVRVTAGAHSWRRVGSKTIFCCVLDRSEQSNASVQDETVLTATAGVSVQWLSTPTVTSRAYLRVGSFVQLGAAVSWREQSGRWALDASWGPGVSLQDEPQDINDGQLAMVSYLPEVGWSWFAKPGGVTSVRLGLTSWTPTLTARMGTETVYAQITAMPWVPGIFDRGAAGQVAVGVTL
jgi:hypothetical protein